MNSTLLILLTLALSPTTLRVEEVQWGYDGKVMPRAFQPLSILISNPSPEAIDTTLTLERRGGVGGRFGARHVEATYLSPGAQRWVQFYPYVADEWTEWRLRWGNRPEDSADLNTPTSTRDPAIVLLSPVTSYASARGGLATFPESAFPPSVTATDTLGVTVLDHEPRWEPVRRQAFVEWIRRGGIVIILYERDGKYPTFTQQLSLLNVPTDTTRMGAGWILRKPILQRDVSHQLRTQLDLFAGQTQRALNEWTTLAFGDSAVPTLKSFTKPNHNWTVLFTLSVLYLLLIGPINWVVGRKIDYRITLAVLLSCVVIFSSIFFFTGRRGFGETDMIHSFAYARPVGDGGYDVMQWTNLFVTRGNTYTVTHDSPFNLYATYFQNESVAGIINNGANGNMIVDIPMYASREMVQRSRFTGNTGPIIASIDQFDPDTAGRIVLRTGEGWPEGVMSAWLVHKEKVFGLNYDGASTLTTSTGGGKSYDQIITNGPFQYNMPQTGVLQHGDEKLSRDKQREVAAERLTRLLIAERADHFIPTSGSPPPEVTNRAQVFILATSPEAWAPRPALRDAPQLGRSIGYVVYHIDLFPSESSSGE